MRKRSARQLAAIGKANILHARRKVGSAWHLIEEAKLVLQRLNRTRPLTPKA